MGHGRPAVFLVLDRLVSRRRVVQRIAAAALQAHHIQTYRFSSLFLAPSAAAPLNLHLIY